MIIKFYDPVTKQELQYYMDGKLKEELDRIKRNIQKKDSDTLIVLDGNEGNGKSVFAMQVAKYIDPTFNLDRLYFHAKDFAEGITNSEPKKSHIFDEAFVGLSSRTSLSEVNHLLNSLIMQMRQRNLFVIVVLPTIFLLDRYVAMFRSKALFHVYMKGSERGRFIIFNRKKKKLLILRGRKDFSYAGVKSAFRGKFTNKYMVDEQEYRRRKLNALQQRVKNVKEDHFKHQRDGFIRMLHFEYKLPATKISKLSEKYDCTLKKSMISDILKKSGKIGGTPP